MRTLKIALVERRGVDYLDIYALVKTPRGIPLLAAILQKAGHQVTCFVESIQRIRWQELFDYDLVGFSIISCTAKPTYTMIRRLRKAGYRGVVIVGGPHATELPEESLQAGANFVVRHEGDKTLPQLVSAIENGRPVSEILGISWMAVGQLQQSSDAPLLTEKELSLLPFPAFGTIVGYEKLHPIPIMFSRGCPFACKFCGVDAMFGHGYRFASFNWRLEQLRYLKEHYLDLWERCTVFFADDNFFGNDRSKAITLEMMEQMIALNLIPPKGWTCQARVGDITPGVAALMKQAGCITVCLGIESALAPTLKALHKGQSPKQIEDGIGYLLATGIEALAMTIAGADTDTFWSFFRSIRKLHKWGITYLQILAMVPLPGTKLTREFIAEGRCFSRNYDRYNGQHVLFRPKYMTRLSVWLSLYLVTFWFYFLTVRGLGLMKRKYSEAKQLIRIVILQALASPWQTLKELFAAK